MKDKMSQDITLRSLVSMTNGVVGLSILTMPYCFEQCGLILSTLALLFSAIMTSYSCKMIIKMIETTKTISFEFLAFKTYGHKGKLLIEICIIMLLYGSLVTNQQTLCDTGPAFITKLLNIENFTIHKVPFMIVFTIFVTLPLSLSKKLDGLHSISTCAVLFYFSFGLYLFWEASYKFEDHKWLEEIKLWDLNGLLKCFPIFSISFSCQTVLFVVYDELEDKTIIQSLADSGISIAFICYFLSGVFGYIAFYDVNIHGNIITNIPETFMSQIILFGFIICVISGFPFMVYPCRTSLNTLFFSNEKNDILESELFIPEYRFKYLTYVIVFMTTSTAVLIPNMEFVLSLTGATAGSLTSYVWPSIIYISSKGNINGNREIIVNLFLAVGITIFIVCTIAALIEYQPTKEFSDTNFLGVDESQQLNNVKNKFLDNNVINNVEVKNNPIPVENVDNKNQVRHEPPNPDYNAILEKILDKKPRDIEPVLKDKVNVQENVKENVKENVITQTIEIKNEELKILK